MSDICECVMCNFHKHFKLDNSNGWMVHRILLNEIIIHLDFLILFINKGMNQKWFYIYTLFSPLVFVRGKKIGRHTIDSWIRQIDSVSDKLKCLFS